MILLPIKKYPLVCIDVADSHILCNLIFFFVMICLWFGLSQQYIIIYA